MTIQESTAAAAGGQMAAALASGIDTISQDQTVTFTLYKRVALPLDGYIFWVNASLFSEPTPIVNSLSNTAATKNNQGSQFSIQGSLHYSTEQQQTEDSSYSRNSVVFTSKVEIEALTATNPNTMYVGEVDGIRFAFSVRRMLYRQAGLFHYQGNAIYGSMATQLVDSLSQLSDGSLIVSNSLPVWLTLNSLVPIYPSFAVPDNITPPWCAVHIEPSSTAALQAIAYNDSVNSHYQLVRDHVRLTLYGLNNAKIMAFYDYVIGYMTNSDLLGLMNDPIIRDEKQTQVEFGTLAQKKTIEFVVSYYQQSILNQSRQLIKNALVSTYYTPLEVS